jgi:hypothetical protein
MRALLPEDATTDFVCAFGADPLSDRQIAFMAANKFGVSLASHSMSRRGNPSWRLGEGCPHP